MRRFECVDGKSSKFWAVDVQGNTTTVTFGKIGGAGQTKSKEHKDGAAAAKAAEKDIAAKLKGGYVEVAAASAGKRVQAASQAAVGHVELSDNPAYARFDLKELTYRIDEDRIEILFDSIEPVQPKKKGKKKDDDDDDDGEDDDDEDDDDWHSKSAWDNYGPNFSCPEGFLECAESGALANLTVFPTTVKFVDDGALSIHCVDHQDTCDNVITFLSKDDQGTLEIDWSGKIKLDSDEEHPHSFRLRGACKRQN
jgi:predicted DNA-binding WGR domain protein